MSDDKRSILTEGDSVEITDPAEVEELPGGLYVALTQDLHLHTWCVWGAGTKQSALSTIPSGDYKRRLLVKVGVGDDEKPKPKEEEKGIPRDDLLQMFVSITRDLSYALKGHNHDDLPTDCPCTICECLGAIHSAITLAKIQGFKVTEPNLAPMVVKKHSDKMPGVGEAMMIPKSGKSYTNVTASGDFL